MLIRVYGNKTDLLIDRRKETENIQLLHRHGYAPALYATFANGLAYQYVPGVTLTPDTCQNDAVWPLVARRMAQMHRVQPDGPTNPKPDLPAKLDQFLRLVPDCFTDPHKDERYKRARTCVPLDPQFSPVFPLLPSLSLSQRVEGVPERGTAAERV